MEEDGWALTVHDAITGARAGSFEPSGESPWSTSIGGDGTSTETLVVNDAERPWAPGEVATMFEPNARLLARWWGDTLVYAQKIEDWDYDKDAGTVTVTASDLLGETDWRMIGGVGSDPHLTLDIVNRTASGAIAAALARMMQWDSTWQYPIDLPADAPGTFSGSWEFWKKHRISDIIKQVQDRYGVEVYLRPYATADGGIRLQTRVGKPITIGSALFKLDAEETPIAGVHYRVNGVRQVTGLLGLGNGSGEDQATAWSGGVVLIPIRDTKQSFPDLTGADLEEATDEYYAANTSPLVQWSVGSYTISADFPPGFALPGTVWQLDSQRDPVIPDGLHTLRVIKASGGNGRKINTEVQSA